MPKTPETVDLNHFFLEKIDFRNGVENLGHSGHSFWSYGFFAVKEKLKAFTYFTVPCLFLPGL